MEVGHASPMQCGFTHNTVATFGEDHEDCSSVHDLPEELLHKILSYLDSFNRNRARKVSQGWNSTIKTGFGIKVILNNHNLEDMMAVDSVVEIQVRNLTQKLPLAPTFPHSHGVSELEIIGMTLSFNLVQLLTLFQNLRTLQLTRVYLETDRRLLISSKTQEKFSTRLKVVQIRFLKTFHARHQQSMMDIFNLTRSDSIVLHILSEFNFPELEILDLTHDHRSAEIELRRNSEMITRSLVPDFPLENESTHTMSTIVTNAVLLGSSSLKTIRIDNLPILNFPPNFQDFLQGSRCHIEHVTVTGIMPGAWPLFLENQTALKALDLVVLYKNLADRHVRNVVKRNRGLVSLAITAATSMDVIPTTGQPEPDAAIRYDLSFLRECPHLEHLKFHFPPKIMDLTVLPRTLTTLDLCGDFEGVLEYCKACPSLKSAKLEVSHSNSLRGNHSRDFPIVFNCTALKDLIQGTNLVHAMIAEVGAESEFEDFMRYCTGKDFIASVELDHCQYCTVPSPPDGVLPGFRSRFVSVPRLSVNVHRVSSSLSSRLC